MRIMIKGLAIFFTIVLAIVMWVLFRAAIDMIPLLKEKWNYDEKIKVISFLLIISVFFAGVIFSIIGMWNSI